MLQTAIDVADAIVLAAAESNAAFATISEELSAWLERAHVVLAGDLIQHGAEVDLWVRPAEPGASERKVRYLRDWQRSLASLATGEIAAIEMGVAAPSDAIRGWKTFRLWVMPVHNAPEMTSVRWFTRPEVVIDELLPPPRVWADALQDAAVAIGAVDGFLTISRAAVLGTASKTGYCALHSSACERRTTW